MANSKTAFEAITTRQSWYASAEVEKKEGFMAGRSVDVTMEEQVPGSEQGSGWTFE